VTRICTPASFLDGFLNMGAEEFQDREVDPRVHQPEGIAGRGDGVEVRSRREISAVYRDAGAVAGAPREFFRGVLALADDGQAGEGHGGVDGMINQFVRSSAVLGLLQS
jgi:hypothetical protein